MNRKNRMEQNIFGQDEQEEQDDTDETKMKEKELLAWI
jgi:hypothetical protein